MNDEGYTVSSDNIFADAGLPNPEECLARVQLLKYVIAESGRKPARSIPTRYLPITASSGE